MFDDESSQHPTRGGFSLPCGGVPETPQGGARTLCPAVVLGSPGWAVRSQARRRGPCATGPPNHARVGGAWTAASPAGLPAWSPTQSRFHGWEGGEGSRGGGAACPRLQCSGPPRPRPAWVVAPLPSPGSQARARSYTPEPLILHFGKLRPRAAGRAEAGEARAQHSTGGGSSNARTAGDRYRKAAWRAPPGPRPQKPLATPRPAEAAGPPGRPEPAPR